MTLEGMADYKTCPMCAEDILQFALVCKHCGHDYTSHSVGGTTTNADGLAIASMVLGILRDY